MTTPKVSTIKRQGSRFYVDPVTGDKHPSVTSITGSAPKPALQYWAARTVAECAVEEFGTLAQMVAGGNPSGAIDYLKRAPGRNSGKAASLGTEVHDLCEKVALGEDVGRLHPDHQGFVTQYEKFIKDFEVSFLEVESTVWSDQFGYAGTLDSIATIDGENILLDIKTGASGVWPDVALQLNAYAKADCLIEADGTRRDMPEIHGAAAVAVRPDKYELIPVRLGDDLFEVFQALTVVSDWEREKKKSVLGNPQTPER